MLVFVYLIIAAGSLYFILIAACAGGLLSMLRKSADPVLGRAQPDLPAVSILVPVRNEAQNLPGLFHDLARQNYPPDRFEVVLIDDHSEDESGRLMQEHAAVQANVQVLSLNALQRGKKAALQAGLRVAKHALILQTDADTRRTADWMAAMMRVFRAGEVRMVAGPVSIEPDRHPLHAIQSLEFFSLNAVTAGVAALGQPVLCNAANLAYYREDALRFYQEAMPRTESGDDVFFLHWLKNRRSGSMIHAGFRDALVCTAGHAGFKAFLVQRIRWTSKSRYFRDVATMLIAALVLLGNAALLTAVLLALFQSQYLRLAGWITALKLAADLALLLPLLMHQRKRHLLWYFLPLSVIYPVYVLLLGFASQLVSVQWKGRPVQSSASVQFHE